MGFQFKKATKAQAKGRVALIGPSGSGKTWTALAIATNLGKRVAVIDTERGSASKYADRFSFDALELETFAPKTYAEAIRAADAEGYDVIVIDSLSHAWMGKDGALEQVDNAQRRQRTPNSFTAWRDVTPQHNALIEAIVSSRAHVIATMRAKTEYVQEKDDRGKTTIRKVGLAPIQRDGLEYEFDVVGDIDLDNTLVISKTRCSDLAEKAFRKPGKDVADILRAWLSDGSAPVERPQPVAHVEPQQEPHQEQRHEQREQPAEPRGNDEPQPETGPTPMFIAIGAQIEQATDSAEIDMLMGEAREAFKGRLMTVVQGQELGAIANRRKALLRSQAAA